jgi:hypothetical protein
MFESLYVHSMNNIDSPVLLDPALFWGGFLVILFYFSLRGFAPSREPKTLPGVRRCQSAISRKDAKARRWGLKMRAKLRQTPPLPEESPAFEAH